MPEPENAAAVALHVGDTVRMVGENGPRTVITVDVGGRYFRHLKAGAARGPGNGDLGHVNEVRSIEHGDACTGDGAAADRG